MGIMTSPTWGADNEKSLNLYKSFEQALQAKDDTQAFAIGDEIFKDLEQSYRSKAGFRTYLSKLTMAEFLTKQMLSHLKRATKQQMFTMSDEILTKPDQQRRPLSLPPAKNFYDTSILVFSSPIQITELADVEKKFLERYYNLKLRTFTNRIAKAGQALTIADPQFQDTHNYVLVLPLLHVTHEQHVNIEILPFWMQKPDQLDILSDACLLCFGMPTQAMELSRQAAEIRNQKFAHIDFYKSAAQKCGPSKAKIAIICLEKAIENIPNSDRDAIIALQFDIAQYWWDLGNFVLAAGQARKIFETYPDSNNYGKAVNLYYDALKRSRNVNAILANIDTAIKDPRCAAYQANLMFNKWRALCRDGKQEASIAAIEHKLLAQHGNNPIVAPIMFSQAMDYFGWQDYLGAKQSLEHLVEKFPNSKAAIKAMEILLKFKKNKW
jgi:tetratricopeptide (TPR) repeat protein